MDNGGISATLAGNGGDDQNPFKTNPYFRAAALSKSLGNSCRTAAGFESRTNSAVFPTHVYGRGNAP